MAGTTEDAFVSKTIYLIRKVLTHVDSSSYLSLLAALGPGVYSASNRNEYQKQKNNNVSGE
jgi:hypothetical protein